MFKKILIPLDGSKIAERALPYARLLAEKLDCEVDLLQVIERGSAVSTTPAPESGREQAGGSAEGYLGSIAGSFAPRSARSEVRHGVAADVIAETAARHPDTLIVMASHGRSGIGRLFLGSVAEKVLRSGKNSMFLVRGSQAADAQVGLSSVVVPLDGSPVAECALGPAAELARSLEAELVLVSVYEIPSTAYFRADDDATSAAEFIPTRAELVEAMSRETRVYLDRKVQEQSAQSKRVRGELLEGPAAERIIELGRNTKGSLIAMCTHGRSGFRRLVLGSVTEKIAHNADGPVLIVRAG